MKTQVYVRTEQRLVDVNIPDKRLSIDQSIKEKWQKIVNLLAAILDVPSGLIMEISSSKMTVLLASENNSNPYSVGLAEDLKCGLYCEAVIGTNEALCIENALKDQAMKDNPDVKAFNMVSYLGVPLKWPDGSFFGTICVLDDKEHYYNDMHKALLEEFREAVECDLELMVKNVEMKHLVERDVLTDCYNRRKMEAFINEEIKRSSRTDETFSLAIFDINSFKEINDVYGHDIGDQILREFCNNFNSRIRTTDRFGRWGGDEFVLLCPMTDHCGADSLVSDLVDQVQEELGDIVTGTSFSYGVGEYQDSDESYSDIVRRADKRLYICKGMILT